MGTLLEQLYVMEMPCPRCKKKTLKLSKNKVLYCGCDDHRVTPEERFLFLEAWVEKLSF